VIIGAGFIGCEVAASARSLGLEVTVVDIAPHPMLPLGSELGERCARVHLDHGVDLRCSTGIAAIRGSDRVQAVELTDGSTVDTDVVLVALGALPNTEWLAGSGLSIDPGVLCDATLTTVDDPDILAAGDIASWPHPLADHNRVRIEHWTTAAEHGQLAGRNAVLAHGERASHELPPYFWSDQYDVKIQYVGHTRPDDEVRVVHGSVDDAKFVVVYGRDGLLTGALGFNRPRQLMTYRRLLARRATWEDALAAAESA
jgi:NADPH-dependent 2,4-dienoyl-CoA reductase/sulfur reductase-like enzyme